MSNLHRGAQVAEGVYTTLLWRSGPPPTWPYHLARLQRDAAQLDLPAPPVAELSNRIGDYLAGRPVDSGASTPLLRLRIRWWGEGGDALTEPALTGQWDLFARPLMATERPGAPQRLRSAGPARFPRRWAGAKITSIGEDLAWRRWAIAHGADDALLCDAAGQWSESPTAAILVGLADGRVGTPGPHNWPVRSTTLEAMAQQMLAAGGVELAQLCIGPADLGLVRWMMLVNATAGGRPVAAVDGTLLQPPPQLWLDLAQSLTKPC